MSGALLIDVGYLILAVMKLADSFISLQESHEEFPAL